MRIFRNHRTGKRGEDVVVRVPPGTVIKDDAIPSLLRKVRLPTFVTINYTDDQMIHILGWPKG